jgi:alpha-1,2-mannosyltransferase
MNALARRWPTYVPLFRTIIYGGLLILIIIGHFAKTKKKSRRFYDCGDKTKLLAFFHPYCGNGGGGERVLWLIIYGLLLSERIRRKVRIIIYTARGSGTKEAILSNVSRRFHVEMDDLSPYVSFVYIDSTPLLEARW